MSLVCVLVALCWSLVLQPSQNNLYYPVVCTACGVPTFIKQFTVIFVSGADILELWPLQDTIYTLVDRSMSGFVPVENVPGFSTLGGDRAIALVCEHHHCI